MATFLRTKTKKRSFRKRGSTQFNWDDYVYETDPDLRCDDPCNSSAPRTPRCGLNVNHAGEHVGYTDDNTRPFYRWGRWES